MEESEKNQSNFGTIYNDSEDIVVDNNLNNIVEGSIDNSLPDNYILQGSKYRIIKQLGQGGFGITYEGIQTGLNRKVAIKEFFMKEFCCREDSTTVSCSQPDNLKKVLSSQNKFLKEARMIADLQHTNIVKIIDVFQENNTAYYVMEHIEGGSLQDKVEMEGPLSEKQALFIIRQIAEALRCVHEHKILHLDVKPANVMMRDEKTAVLIDFGISKHYAESGTQTTTSPVGISRGYAPIEQYNEGGVATFSPATDIYSLGATLLFMLTGKRPPEAQMVFSGGLPPFPKGISQSTREAITAAMRPSRAERPQSVSAFLSILGGEQVSVETDSQLRYIIEQLEIQGEYKEAYLRCIDCIDKGIEIEFAKNKVSQLIPYIQEKQYKSSRWLNILAVLFVVLLFVCSLFYIIYNT